MTHSWKSSLHLPLFKPDGWDRGWVESQLGSFPTLNRTECKGHYRKFDSIGAIYRVNIKRRVDWLLILPFSISNLSCFFDRSSSAASFFSSSNLCSVCVDRINHLLLSTWASSLAAGKPLQVCLLIYEILSSFAMNQHPLHLGLGS